MRTKLYGLIVSGKDFANLVKVSQRTVRNWVDSGLPGGKGGIPLLEGHDWWMQNISGDAEGETLMDIKKQKLQIETELRKIELLIRQGELLPKKEIISHNVAAILDTKFKFLRLHRTLQTRLAKAEPREMGDIIKKEIRQILTNFERSIRRGVRK